MQGTTYPVILVNTAHNSGGEAGETVAALGQRNILIILRTRCTLLASTREECGHWALSAFARELARAS